MSILNDVITQNLRRPGNGYQQGSMLAYGEWVEENVLAPLPHRQYVFSLPKLLRPWFRHDRTRLGKFCQLVAKLMVKGYQAIDPRGKPGFMLYVQTFADLVTFNPHIHALVADGVFYPSGSFRVLPPIPEVVLSGLSDQATLNLWENT